MNLVIITDKSSLLATHAVMYKHLNYVPIYSMEEQLYQNKIVLCYKIKNEDLLFLELISEGDDFEKDLDHMANATIWGIVEGD